MNKHIFSFKIKDLFKNTFLYNDCGEGLPSTTFLLKQKSSAGFTVIEILIVIGITAILALAAVPIYGNLQTRAQVRETSSQIVQAIRGTKIKAEVGLNNTGHGVYFDIDPLGQDFYILYQGESYALRFSDYDQIFKVDEALEIENIDFDLTGNDIDINFSKFEGLPDNVGSLRILHEVTGERVVEVGELGQIQGD